MKTFKIRSVNPYSGLFEEYQKKVESGEGKNKKTEVLTYVISSAPRSAHDVPKPLPVDQFAGQKFMLNASGFPMNDILAFESVQSDQLARAVLNRTQILNLPANKEMSIEDQFATIVPANWSSPAEFVRASQKYAQFVYAKQMAAQRESAAQAAAQAAQKEKDSTVVPADPE